MRRLLEHEELVFDRALGLEAHGVRLVDDAAEHAARADLLGLLGELAQEEQRAVLVRQVAAGVGQQAHGRIGIGGVPAGVGDVVVELVVGIPAQHDVAEADAGLEAGKELVAAQILAAQDAVGVEDADLDVAEIALADDLAGVVRRLNLPWIHAFLPPVT